MHLYPTRFFLPEHQKRSTNALLPGCSNMKHGQSSPGQQDNYIICKTKVIKTTCSEFFSCGIHDIHVCVVLCLFVYLLVTKEKAISSKTEY